MTDYDQRRNLFLWFAKLGESLIVCFQPPLDRQNLYISMQEIANTISGFGLLAEAGMLWVCENHNVVDYRFLLSLGIKLCELGESLVRTIFCDKQAQDLLLSIEGCLFGLRLLIQGTQRRDYCSNWNDKDWRKVKYIIEGCYSIFDRILISRQHYTPTINLNAAIWNCRSQNRMINSVVDRRVEAMNNKRQNNAERAAVHPNVFR